MEMSDNPFDHSLRYLFLNSSVILDDGNCFESNAKTSNECETCAGRSLSVRFILKFIFTSFEFISY